MKITLKSLVVASSLLLAATPAFAHGDHSGAGARGSRTPADRVHAMEEQLGLTEAQAVKIEAIFTAEADALKALREKKLEPKLQREEIKKLRETYKTQLVAELTAEQKAKYEAAAAERAQQGGREGAKPEGAKTETK